ncbi:hypothetical protein KQ939_09880 [Planococcus sp. CP5-4]|uniref:hypothetical protein n=1 Tax=unclassified Planococcus (in: firmicutes) TaxID=2662419 RepID=UPI001C219F14|nr:MULTISPECIES: hypothetical protein [unclassified Planococcus (in: firmicutes)]MBU9673846.1 hypothetical protein [Planococcus sp. CP5-4_YE]MBV0908974.1 hypothetical protein [Planococcus sp. CP5-4_UN]MBW6064023.1 hypothetical protein [Planococcus sp. CP5-4]
MIFNKVVGKIVGFFFIAMGYLFFNHSIIADDILLIFIIEIWIGYFLTFIGAGFLLNEIFERNKVAAFIYTKILSIPAIGFIYFHYISAPILTILMFLGIYLIPSVLFLSFKEAHPIFMQYSQGIVYILSLLSVLFFAYKSNNIMKFIILTFETKLFKNSLIKYTNKDFTRILTYIFMIFIYISYNFLSFSNVNFTLFPTQMMNVIKEVFVTFVAIDSLMHIYLSEQQKTKEFLNNN